MITVYSEDHQLHDGLLLSHGDAWLPSVECPARANNVAAAILDRNLGEIIAPRCYADDKLTAVHDADYVEFLSVAWDEWVAQGETGSNAKPFVFVGAGMRHADSNNIHSKFGRYSFDTDAPIVSGSWQAIRRSAEIALTGADLVLEGESFAFSACRPPGHHATAAFCGGYCYLNNSALAAPGSSAKPRKNGYSIAGSACRDIVSTSLRSEKMPCVPLPRSARRRRF